MGEIRSVLWNDSGLALNLDGTKIDQDNLDGGKEIKTDLDGTFWEKCLVRWNLKHDPFLDGCTEHGFLCGGKSWWEWKDYLVETRLKFNPNLKGRYLAERGSGFTLILKGTTIWNPQTKKPWWDRKEYIIRRRFKILILDLSGGWYGIFGWRNRDGTFRIWTNKSERGFARRENQGIP